jgi:hypothetical protein
LYDARGFQINRKHGLRFFNKINGICRIFYQYLYASCIPGKRNTQRNKRFCAILFNVYLAFRIVCRVRSKNIDVIGFRVYPATRYDSCKFLEAQIVVTGLFHHIFLANRLAATITYEKSKPKTSGKPTALANNVLGFSTTYFNSHQRAYYGPEIDFFLQAL